MKNLKLTTMILLLATYISCSKKVYTEDELKRIAKTDSIKKEQMKMLEDENINNNEENKDIHREQNEQE